MTLIELKKALSDRLRTLEEIPEMKDIEFENSVMFVMPVPKYMLNKNGPPYPQKVRTPFGLVKWYPANDGIIIYPKISQVKKLILKLEQIPPPNPRSEVK